MPPAVISLSRLEVQRESSGASWSVKAKGEEKATFRQGRRSSCSPARSLLQYHWDARGEPCSLQCWSRGAPCLHDAGEQPQQSPSDGTRDAKRPSALEAEDLQMPLAPLVVSSQRQGLGQSTAALGRKDPKIHEFQVPSGSQ